MFFEQALYGRLLAVHPAGWWHSGGGCPRKYTGRFALLDTADQPGDPEGEE
jgi:hypothetical protein